MPITFIFLLLVATGLYGESDDQPMWNITLFGAVLSNKTTAISIGGAVSCLLTPQLELEGELYTFSYRHRRYYSSSASLLYNFDIEKTTIYLLTGISVTKNYEVSLNAMLGGGIKKDITKKFKIRLFDCRLHFGERVGFRLSSGFIWTF